jgi:hypothetical protein
VNDATRLRATGRAAPPVASSGVRELLRPPPHRGPLIAAGAVVLAVGLALAELRLGDELSSGVHLAILATASAVILALGLQAPNEDGRPPAYQSVLLVTGLLLLFAALLRLADVLGADSGDLIDGELVWTGLVLAGAALWASIRRRSAVCLLIAAIAATLALLAAWDWIFNPGTFTASRWLLLLVAGALTVASLTMRASAPRHAEVLVDGAALAILTIGLQAVLSAVLGSIGLFGLGDLPETVLPGFWEVVVLAAGCGLVAFGAIDRSPGPAWLGVANLATFVVAVGQGDETLYWWPLVLIVLGCAAMLAGLRPRQPLPPEPDPYRAGGRPLASHAADEEVVVHVRDDSPPPAGSVPER